MDMTALGIIISTIGLIATILGILVMLYLERRKEKKFITTFETKEEYNKAVINVLEEEPKILRLTIIGPHFLHPQRVIKRRLELGPGRESFSLALRKYLENSIDKPERDIKLFIRNSPRYLHYLTDPPPLVRSEKEVSELIDEMITTLDKLFSSEKNIKFCCKDPSGYFSNVMITEKHYFEHIRSMENTPLEGGILNEYPSAVNKKLKNFDELFNNYSECRNFEMQKSILKDYIRSLDRRLKELWIEQGRRPKK